MRKNYYYFATHTRNRSIFARLEASVWFKGLNKKEQKVIKRFVEKYDGGDHNYHTIDYCIEFIDNHKKELRRLIKSEGFNLKFYLESYLQFFYEWDITKKSFGKKSNKRAEKITEKELISEMTNPKGSIKKLLDSAGGDLSVVKDFLPAVMISLDTNTRNRNIMDFKHTGKFCFDIDKLEDREEAREWLDKLWVGTKKLKPYMAFISPRGKGVKLFCQVDTSNDNFKDDFSVEERSIVMNNHKIWYEGARKKIIALYPELTGKFDTTTNDPQRLTYIPFVSDPNKHFKYNPKAISEYSTLVEQEKEQRRIEKEKKMKKHEAGVKALMQKEGLQSKDDAYNLFLKNRSKDFDLEFELDKFKKVVAYIVDLSKKDTRVKKWLEEKFSSYGVLNKQAWVLYGVFGSIAIDELKKLIPLGSNKLDESHGDYRWANKSDDTYDEETRLEMTPAPFYKLVFEIGAVKDYCLADFSFTSSCVSDFKLINSHYKNYKYNLDLLEEDKNLGDKEAFLQQIKHHLKSKKNRLPLLKALEEIKADIKLGKSDYLDKKKMEDLFQNKYGDKKIFMLRSQCGKQPVPS